MTMPGSFRAQLRLPQMAGSRLTDALIKGMGAEPLEETAQGTRLAHTFGRIAVETQASGLDISLDADDRTSLAYLQLSISHRLQSLEKGIELPWDSDNRPGMLLPYFRKMQVVSTHNLTPSMRRVRLAGEDLERFSRNGLHMRLLFPPAGSASPSWPQIGRNGDAVWPDDENRPVARVYTIRTIDVAAGLIDVDMVLHEGDAYPGAGWAARAKPGDIVGMTGPGGAKPRTPPRWCFWAMKPPCPPSAAFWKDCRRRRTPSCASRSPVRRRSSRFPPARHSIWNGSCAAMQRLERRRFW